MTGNKTVRAMVLVLWASAFLPAAAHSPLVDGDPSDWCFSGAPRVEDSAAVFGCLGDTESVWWDARADGAVNDLGTVATTQDPGRLYWILGLHTIPDPVSLPIEHIAIDVAPGGNAAWFDPVGALREPGSCSASTGRACTVDADCHFCAVSTVHTGTPQEQPRPCGSTTPQCDPLDPLDVCSISETCVDAAAGPAVPFAGQGSIPVIEPDYLLVFDSGRLLNGACDAVGLFRADAGAWVEIPRPVPDPFCPRPTWRFTPATALPGYVEFEVPWEAFDCAGCAPFDAGIDFSWTAMVSRGLLNGDFAPDLPIEDVMSEAAAGTTTATGDSCAVPGPATTRCEIADGSTDAFAPGTAGAPGGRVDGLVLQRETTGNPTPSITLSWNPSCSTGDTDYEVYEGRIGVWYSHVRPAAGDVCTTAGATTATFDAGADDHYYLVVPSNGATEGSYGEDGATAERPVSAAFCRPRSLGACP